MSDLQEEFAAAVELQDLVFGRPVRASPGDPDVVLVIDKDSVLVVGQRPFVAVAGTVPALQQRPDGSNCMTAGAGLQHAFFSVTLPAR